MWFVLAALSALSASFADLFGKRASVAFHPDVTAWGQRFCAAVILLVAAWCLTGGPPATDAVFWKALCVSTVVNVATSLLYVRALLRSPLSLTAPVLALSPTFLLVTAPIINREAATLIGLVGVLISMAGAYLLGMSRTDEGWLAPLRSLWKDPGARMMLAVAALWSISAPFDKIASQHVSNAAWYPAIFNGVLAVLLFPIALRRGGLGQALRPSGLIKLAPIGVFMGLSHLFQMRAFTLASVAYVVSVKRLSAVFGVLWGWRMYHEEGIRLRLIGALVLCGGAALILLGGR